MKVLALDIGDKWVGSALSDALQITCKPLKTVLAQELESFISQIVPQENITTIVIGHPITMSGTSSDQTKKVEKTKEMLEQKYSSINNTPILWVLWDERLSSKRATQILREKKKSARRNNDITDHDLAAAFILQGYLDHKALS